MEPEHGENLLETLAKRAGGVLVTVSLGPRDDSLELAAGCLGTDGPIRLAHLGADPELRLLGEVLGDVPDLVDLAALDERLVTENVTQRPSQATASVDDAQERPRELQPSLQEVLQEFGAENRVLGGAEAKTEHVLAAESIHAEGDDDALLLHRDPVEHQGGQVERVEAAP